MLNKKSILLSVALLVAFAFSANLSAAEKKFALVSKCVHPYFGPVYAGFEAAGKKYGVETEYVAPIDYVLQEQVKSLENLIVSKIDGIAVAAIDDEGLASTINQAMNSGIKVVCFDSDAKSSKRLSYIGTNNYEAGRVGAEYMSETLKLKGNMAVIQGGLGSSNINLRYQGFVDYLAKNNPELKIVAREDTETKFELATNKTEAILQSNKDLVGIFGFTAECAPGAAIAVEDADLAGKMVLGGFDDLEDTLESIRTGTVSFCLAQMTYKMGWLSLVNLLKATEGKNIPDEIDTGMMIITIDNVDNYYEQMQKEASNLK